MIYAYYSIYCFIYEQEKVKKQNWAQLRSGTLRTAYDMESSAEESFTSQDQNLPNLDPPSETQRANRPNIIVKTDH